jgi:1-acyl-sn-glycerol-3-phosphate acyltransferase
MIKANHHRLWQWFFDRYIQLILRTDFRTIEVEGAWPDDEQSALLIGNHFSWWDGFWALYLNNMFLRKRLYVMMLEEQLRLRMFLSRLGAFSINPGSRSVVESLDYAAERLSTPGNLVVVYPQGRIASATSDLPAFERGIDRVLQKSNNLKVLFYAAFTDYFSHRKPGLYFYLKEVGESIVNTDDLRNKYASFYEASRMEQSKKAT